MCKFKYFKSNTFQNFQIVYAVGLVPLFSGNINMIDINVRIKRIYPCHGFALLNTTVRAG